MTGGILVDYTPMTIKILSQLDYEEQWNWLKTLTIPNCKNV
ncbi:MAG: hypothetical protein ACOC2W_03815 [bacterium]